MENERKIVGTSTKLEKEYYRITIDPGIETIRPKDILKQALEFIMSKSSQYNYLCEQLKSIRQDMMLQGVKDEFAVEVYETHCRLALENKDLVNFNQCQTQLFELYKEGYTRGNVEEFVSYKLLYLGLHSFYIELSTTLKELKYLKKSECIIHAMKVIKAYNNKDYKTFINLRNNSPNLNKALMDIFLNRIRVFYLQQIAKSL